MDRVAFGTRRDELDLDGEHAYQMFFSKSHNQAVEMFREAALGFSEDLMWMPLVCFQYYVNAYIEYLKSDSAIDDADGANAFFGLIQFRSHEVRKLDERLKTKIIGTIQFLGNNQQRFDAEPENTAHSHVTPNACWINFSAAPPGNHAQSLNTVQPSSPLQTAQEM